MTVSLKHKFSSAKADSADTSLIRPSNWNDEHDLTLATDRLLGRDTTGAGAAEEITVAGGIEFTGAGGIQRSALTGDVTASAGSNATTIANDSVTYAKIQNVSTNNKVLGRSTAGAGDIEELSVGTGLTLSSGTLSVTANTYSATGHGHAISDVTGLQTALDGKAPLNGFGTSGNWPISISGTAQYAAYSTFANDASVKDNIATRTETGFYQTSTGTTAEGWPVNDGSFQHLIASTHDNESNYYSMQIAASFYSQNWYFRNTNGNGAQGWSVMLHNNNYTTYAVATYNNTSLNTDSRNTRGVTRLYRRDDNSDFSVQTYWTGSYWRLLGYNGDTYHADTHVGYADNCWTANNAGYATSAGAVDGSWLASWLAGRNVGSLGSYAFLRTNTLSNLTAGNTVAGSDLRYSNANGSIPAGGLAGTWMLMGNTGTANNSASTSVWLRVA